MKPSLSILRARLGIVVGGALCTVLVASPAEAKKRSAAIPSDARVLKVEVDKSHAIDEHRLEIRMSRPPGKILLTVTSEDGHVIVDRVDDFTGRAAGVPLVISWEQTSDQSVGSIQLRMHDRDENYIDQEYSAWYVPIAHEDVNFRTDSSDIDAAEVSKLDEAFAKVQEVLSKDKAREHKNLTLYVAGHTDTVGNGGYNLKLSQARAQSLARWFRQKGVRIPIAYEGFGETALRVQTPDETDEPRNRRADYILADDPPSMKSTGFKPGWKRVN
jgi:outer membrane protein OmpA-like peptidoglycan-associated protein